MRFPVLILTFVSLFYGSESVAISMAAIGAMAAGMAASVLSSVTVFKITSTLDHRDKLKEEAEEEKNLQDNFQQQQIQQQQQQQQQKIFANRFKGGNMGGGRKARSVRVFPPDVERLCDSFAQQNRTNLKCMIFDCHDDVYPCKATFPKQEICWKLTKNFWCNKQE